ncbi:MAG TPA: hypothetical protein VHI93_09180 [Candidatus Thermoplasmatota archaeon]|nr:hypothetical protein [Candidatus Thermoplasmatota archaeon]
MSFRPGEAPFDRWSLAHVASGAALGLVLSSFLWAFVLLTVYEAAEGALRRVKRDPSGRGLFEYESWPNILADVLVGLAGFVAVRLAGTPTVL